MESIVSVPENAVQNTPDIKVYKKRLWMLFLFCLLSMMSTVIYPQYVIMASVNSCFYDVSLEAINWTSMIFLTFGLVFSLPASYLIDHYLDLRWTLICTALFNVLASCLHFGTIEPDGFVYVMLTTLIFSISNVLIQGIPPFLAARWFPDPELSKACAFGLFGYQIGIGVGFVWFPQMVSNNCSQKDLISIGKKNISYILFAVNLIICLLIIFTFQNAPKLPPSIGESQKKNEFKIPYLKVVLSMMKNTDFILIFLTFGFMAGSVFAFGALLDELVLGFFPHKEKVIGWLGLLFVVSGAIGSFFAGGILDWSKKFKETMVVICFASLISFIFFGGCLYIKQIWIQFLTICIFGFFVICIFPIAFEFAIEVTYPQSEVVSACLLNASSLFFGIVLTEILSHFLESNGALSSNAAVAVTLLLCCIIASFSTKDYKRSKNNKETEGNAANCTELQN